MLNLSICCIATQRDLSKLSKLLLFYFYIDKKSQVIGLSNPTLIKNIFTFIYARNNDKFNSSILAELLRVSMLKSECGGVVMAKNSNQQNH